MTIKTKIWTIRTRKVVNNHEKYDIKMCICSKEFGTYIVLPKRKEILDY